MRTEPGLYRAFGMTLATDLPIRLFGPATSASPDLVVSRRNSNDLYRSAPVLYSSPDSTVDGVPILRVSQLEDRWQLEFSRGAVFTLAPGSIEYAAPGEVSTEQLEIWLAGTVLAFYLEISGCPVLHASAVALCDDAALFLAGNRAGKSTLAAALLKSGCRLLTDDLAPLRAAPDGAVVLPSYPRMRFWPEQACLFTAEREDLPAIIPGHEKRIVSLDRRPDAFCADAMPVGAVYLPEHVPLTGGSDPFARISPVTGPEAIAELMRRCFLTRLYGPLGWAADRMRFFAPLSRRVYRLQYSSGPASFPAVTSALLAHRLDSGPGEVANERGRDSES